MRLSEAISLGHTLIGEGLAYYDEETNCGCAIGSAAAALNALHTPGWLVIWCERQWPWTREPAKGFPALFVTHPIHGETPRHFISNEYSVAMAISSLHLNGYLNRLEIAALIAQIEPPEPEASETPAPATVEVAS